MRFPSTATPARMTPSSCLANGSSGIDPSRRRRHMEAFRGGSHRRRADARVSRGGGWRGATKQLQIQVVGAQTEAHAREVGRANRALVAGEDRDLRRRPQLGSRAGGRRRAGVSLVSERITSRPRLTVVGSRWANRWCDGARRHRACAAHFRAENHSPPLDLGLGRAEAVVWICDLSPEYVRNQLRLHVLAYGFAWSCRGAWRPLCLCPCVHDDDEPCPSCYRRSARRWSAPSGRPMPPAVAWAAAPRARGLRREPASAGFDEPCVASV